jgi:hypothetical protein
MIDHSDVPEEKGGETKRNKNGKKRTGASQQSFGQLSKPFTFLIKYHARQLQYTRVQQRRQKGLVSSRDGQMKRLRQHSYTREKISQEKVLTKPYSRTGPLEAMKPQ